MKNQIKLYFLNIMTGESQGVMVFFIKLILLPFSGIYFLVWFFRNLGRPFFENSFDNKIISVGNITMGGVGKTPFVVYLAQKLVQESFFPVILSRGYTLSHQEESDEVAMMKELMIQTPIVMGKKRALSIRQAQKQYSPQSQMVFLMDDGFQHWAVKRDIDIVLLDARNPFGNQCLIPAGILREPLWALQRALFFVLTHTENVDEKTLLILEQELKKLNPKAFLIRTEHTFKNLTHLVTGKETPVSSLTCEKVALWAGIGSPESFRSGVQRMGFDIASQHFFIDHCEYSLQQIQDLIADCKVQNIKTVLVTHKDAVKLKKFSEYFQEIDIYIIHIEIKVTNGENEFLARMLSLLVS